MLEMLFGLALFIIINGYLYFHKLPIFIHRLRLLPFTIFGPRFGNFHCMLIKFTHKAPDTHTHDLFVCLLLYPAGATFNVKMLLWFAFSVFAVLLSITSERWSCESAKIINIEYVSGWLDSVSLPSFFHSVNPWFYIHKCITFLSFFSFSFLNFCA